MKKLIQRLESTETSNFTPEEQRVSLLENLYELGHADACVFVNLSHDSRNRSKLTALSTLAKSEDEKWNKGVFQLLNDEVLTTSNNSRVSFTDFACPDPKSRRTFQPMDEVTTRLMFTKSELYKYAFAPFGINDAQRMLIYDSSRFVGWIGFVRRGKSRFTEKDKKRLQPIVPIISKLLIDADRIERQLHQFRRCRLLVDESGNVVQRDQKSAFLFESKAGAFAIDHLLSKATREKLKSGDVFDTAANGFNAHWIPLTGSGSASFIVEVQPPKAIEISNNLALLTPSRREIVELSAQGFTAREIARNLNKSFHTVRTQLRLSYAQLGVSNRAELVKSISSLSDDLFTKPRK